MKVKEKIKLEKGFIILKESSYYKDLKKHCENKEQQRNFVNNFFSNKGIEANEYKVSGNGLVNSSFNEYSKNDIRLYIKPTESDFKKFGEMLCKPSKDHSLCAFKKNSNIAKEFAQNCIDKQIIINLWPPRANDYFKSLEYGIYGCSYERFSYNEELYMKIESKYLKEDDIPKGFKEIKLSEYYKAKEEYEKEII